MANEGEVRSTGVATSQSFGVAMFRIDRHLDQGPYRVLRLMIQTVIYKHPYTSRLLTYSYPFSNITSTTRSKR